MQAVLAGLGITEAQLPAVYAVIDKIGRDPRQVLEQRLAQAGVSTETSARLFDVARPIEDVEEFGRWCEAHGCGEQFETVRRYLAYLAALGVCEWVRLDLSIVRGLAYYTGIVFELFDAKGELRAICGGGRYDKLLASLGGADLPALGFGMGDVVLGELLRQRGLMPSAAPGVDVWVAYAEPAALPSAMHVAAQLRERGRSVEYALAGQKLARQLKAAGAAGAREVVILASAELERGEAVVRRMADGEERRVSLDAWLDEI
jgi:histidyl-tRNA synthetase